MKSFRSSRPKANEGRSRVQPDAPDGKNAVAVQPPSYGVNMVDRLQPELMVSQPNDPLEQEADRIADQVMRVDKNESVKRGRATQTDLQRAPVEEEEKDLLKRVSLEEDEEDRLYRECLEEGKDEKLNTKAASTTEHVASDQARRHVLALRGGGQRLPENERGFFEPRFGTDFSHVRIHSDSSGDEAARAVQARAFALGNDIAFRSGEYQPRSDKGRRLLAHELAHIIQQSRLPVGGRIQREGPTNTEEYQAAYLDVFQQWWSNRDTDTLEDFLRNYVGFHALRVHIYRRALEQVPGSDPAAMRGALAHFSRDREAEIIPRLMADPALGFAAWESTLRGFHAYMDARPELVRLRNMVEQRLLDAYAHQSANEAVGQAGADTEEIRRLADIQVRAIVGNHRQDFLQAASNGVNLWIMPHIPSSKWPEVLSSGSLLAGSIGSIVTVGAAAGTVIASAGIGLLIAGVGLGIFGILSSISEEAEDERHRQLERSVKSEVLAGYEAISEGIEAQEDVIAMLCTTEAMKEGINLNTIGRGELRDFIWRKMFEDFPEDATAGRTFVEQEMHRELDHRFED